MKISIITLGTQGDVQPYLGLGIGLKEAGYDVAVAAADNYQDFVLNHGLKFFPLGFDMDEILHSLKGLELNNTKNPFWVIRRIRNLTLPIRAHLRKSVPEVIKHSDAIVYNVIIYHHIVWADIDLAERLRIPYFIVSYNPDLSPTKKIPCLRFSVMDLGPFLNKASYYLVDFCDYLLNRLFCNDSGPLYSKLKMLFTYRSMLKQAGIHSHSFPILYFYSRDLMPAIDDSETNSVVTGPWFLNLRDNYSPPDYLSDFLKEGDQPIYIGFGSMVLDSSLNIEDTVIRALRKTGQRGILSCGYKSLSKANPLPDFVRRVDFVPHDWLFPKMRAIVHHGGFGTTIAGLRAGKPSIICPFAVDQPFWGNRIYQLGVGPKPIPIKQLTVDKLGDSIEMVVNNKKMQEQAAALGEKIQNENGVDNAVRSIEKYLQKSRIQ